MLQRDQAICTLQGSDQPRRQLFEWAKQAGFHRIEAGCVTHIDVQRVVNDPAYFAELEKDVKDTLPLDSISIHPWSQGLCADPTPDDDGFAGQVGADIWGDGKAEGINHRAEAKILVAIQAARKLHDAGLMVGDRPAIRWFTGSPMYQRRTQHYPGASASWIKSRWDRIRPRLHRVLDKFEELGVDPCEEPHVGELVFDIASLNELREQLGPKYADLFCFNFDPSHPYHMRLNPCTFASAIGAKGIKRVHLKGMVLFHDSAVANTCQLPLGSLSRPWNYGKLSRTSATVAAAGLPTVEDFMAHINKMGVDPSIAWSHEVEDDDDSYNHAAEQALAWAIANDFVKDDRGHQERMKKQA